MLSQQHSQVNNTLSKFESKNEIPSGLSPQKIPKYLDVNDAFYFPPSFFFCERAMFG